VKTIKTQNVSLPVELHEWVLKKMEQTKLSTPWAKVTFSSIVEHALVELRVRDEHLEPTSPDRASKACDDDDDKIIDPEKLYPNGLPAEMRRRAAVSGTQGKTDSKKRPQSSSKKLPKKTA
jgi:hypothetical protein